MVSGRNDDRPPGGGRMFLKFLLIVFGIVGTFLILVTVAGISYAKFVGTPQRVEGGVIGVDGTPAPTDQGNDGGLLSSVFPAPIKTNALVVGVDDEAELTDTMMVVSFDRETKKFDLVSLPRDTYTELSPDLHKKLDEMSDFVPSDGVLKLNSIYNKANDSKGITYLKQAVEDLLGIKINYTLEINTAAFRSIVDAIGGVDVVVRPEGMYYYDPTPVPPLRIEIPGGPQHLDGATAEGFVRYRWDYPNGDLGRVETQQQFLKEVFRQVLQKDNLVKNALSVIPTLLNYTKTDFPVTDLPKYVSYISDLKPENMVTHTLPGEGVTLYPGGVETSFYMLDDTQLRELVDYVFYNAPAPSESPEPGMETESASPSPSAMTDEELKALYVQVLNGGEIAGTASRAGDKLTAEGYNVVNVGNYSGTLKHETRIMVRDKAAGEHFKKLFDGSVVEVMETLPADYDVIIIIGLDAQ